MRLKNVSKVCLNAPLVMDCIREHQAEKLEKTVFFQIEHNLVLPGGRSLEPDDPLGVIPSMYNPAERYHVRVVGKKWYHQSDIVLEYNVPNIVNIETSGIFPDEVVRKIVYAPSLPWPHQSGGERDLAIISNVNAEGEERRLDLIRRLGESCPAYQNILGSYEWNDVQRLYARTKVLVNFHRTWHHHSIEEFRVLPALSQGCIVISEDVPLREKIPYHEYVIWSSYDELPAVAAKVTSNYEDYVQRIHGSGGLAKLLDGMKDAFRRDFVRLLR